jgi:hypothetical protein
MATVATARIAYPALGLCMTTVLPCKSDGIAATYVPR